MTNDFVYQVLIKFKVPKGLPWLSPQNSDLANERFAKVVRCVNKGFSRQITELNVIDTYFVMRKSLMKAAHLVLGDKPIFNIHLKRFINGISDAIDDHVVVVESYSNKGGYDLILASRFTDVVSQLIYHDLPPNFEISVSGYSSKFKSDYIADNIMKSEALDEIYYFHSSDYNFRARCKPILKTFIGSKIDLTAYNSGLEGLL